VCVCVKVKETPQREQKRTMREKTKVNDRERDLETIPLYLYLFIYLSIYLSLYLSLIFQIILTGKLFPSLMSSKRCSGRPLPSLSSASFSILSFSLSNTISSRVDTPSLFTEVLESKIFLFLVEEEEEEEEEEDDEEEEEDERKERERERDREEIEREENERNMFRFEFCEEKRQK